MEQAPNLCSSASQSSRSVLRHSSKPSQLHLWSSVTKSCCVWVLLVGVAPMVEFAGKLLVLRSEKVVLY